MSGRPTTCQRFDFNNATMTTEKWGNRRRLHNWSSFTKRTHLLVLFIDSFFSPWIRQFQMASSNLLFSSFVHGHYFGKKAFLICLVSFFVHFLFWNCVTCVLTRSMTPNWRAQTFKSQCEVGPQTYTFPSRAILRKIISQFLSYLPLSVPRITLLYWKGEKRAFAYLSSDLKTTTIDIIGSAL